MQQPIHAPYAGPTKVFSIGLNAIDPKRWIEPDGDLGMFLDEKDRLCRSNFPDIFRAETDSGEAQQECLDLLAAHLTDDHPDLFRQSGGAIEFAGRRIPLSQSGKPPLLTAGALVQDDLVILQRRDTGWHVVAGYVAFPSAWSLAEKIGRPMEEVHGPVPGFHAGTRNAMLINRIFDNLQPDQPAMRYNWSIYPAGDLYWPMEVKARYAGDPFVPANNIVRVERQTLRRLPKTGAIVFTIRIYIDPIRTLLAQPNGAALATGLADRLEEFAPEQLDYKGMVDRKAALVAHLRQAAANIVAG